MDGLTLVEIELGCCCLVGFICVLMDRWAPVRVGWLFGWVGFLGVGFLHHVRKWEEFFLERV